MGIRKAIIQTAKEIMSRWATTSLPTKTQSSIVVSLTKLRKKYLLICKSKYKTSEGTAKTRSRYIDEIQLLYDISKKTINRCQE